jgi:hypothetical protein
MRTPGVLLAFFCVLTASSAFGLVAGDIDSSSDVDVMDVQLVINGALGGRSVQYRYRLPGKTVAMDVQLVINAARSPSISTPTGTASAVAEIAGTGVPTRHR